MAAVKLSSYRVFLD